MGKSSALESVLEKVRLVGPSKQQFFLTGETGTGKGVVCSSQFIKIAIGPMVILYPGSLCSVAIQFIRE